MKYKWQFWGGVLVAIISASGAVIVTSLTSQNNKELEVLKQQSSENEARYKLELEKIKIAADAEQKKLQLAAETDRAKIKYAAEAEAEKIVRIENRCKELSSLLEEISSTYYGFYSGGSSEDIQWAMDKFSKLKALQQKAVTYFGDEANKVYLTLLGELKQSKKKDPVDQAIPYIGGLKKELSSCNQTDLLVAK
jgi:murein DD-endopeptidase MepM/ murein hydrolase activator NlpD